MTTNKNLSVTDCEALCEDVVRNANAIINSSLNATDPMMDANSALLYQVYIGLARKLELSEYFLRPIEGAKTHAISICDGIRGILKNYSGNPDACAKAFAKIQTTATEFEEKTFI